VTDPDPDPDVRGARAIVRKPLLRALDGEAVSPPPQWLMRQAGRYLPEYRALRAEVGSFLDLCYTPDKAAEVTLQPIRRFGMDAAILFSDILVVPHALGQDVAFREGEGPVLPPLAGADDLAQLSLERLHERLVPVYETVARVAGALPAETTLIGFAGAPWTVATYMVEGGSSRDFAATKAWAYDDPAGFDALIALLIEATAAYLDRQVRAGAEVVQLFDTWAGVLPPDAFRRWAIAPVQAIVARLKADHPGVPVIGFPRGAGLMYPEYAAATGICGIGLDTAVPPEQAAALLQPHVTVQGNLDPLKLVAGGAGMAAAVADILGALSSGPFIFNLGHGIVPQTPPEHVATLIDLVREGPR